jgi:valyl-tRNA synthetase
MGMGADLILDHRDLEKSFAPGRNFATKLWNIGRFLLTNVGTAPVRSVDELTDAELTLPDRWILGRLNSTVRECDIALGPPRPSNGKWRSEERYAGLRLSEYAESARRFVWNDIADWYLESTKGRIARGTADGEVARAILTHVFDHALRLLHPVMPFITETLWQRLPSPVAAERVEFLAVAGWPTALPASREEMDAMTQFDILREAVTGLRQVRSDYNIAPGKPIDAMIRAPRNLPLFRSYSDLIGRLGRANLLLELGDGSAPDAAGAAHVLLSDGSEVIVPLGSLVDLSRECGRLRGELEQLETQLRSLSQRLRNEGFISRAPATVVEAERKKEEEWQRRREHLSDKVKALCGD